MGTGIAAGMMDEFINLAKKKNFDYARLSVYRSNSRARKFYENMGWTEEETNNKVIGYYKKLN